MGALLCFPLEVFGRTKHYETYAYKVVKHYGTWSVRHYAPAVAAETGGTGKDENNNFRCLAKYIGVFGKPENEAQAGVAMTVPVVSEQIAMTTPAVTTEAIAMTTPVVCEPGERGSPMRFVLPSKYRKASEAPAPTDPEVRLVDIPAKVMAAIEFSGTCRGCGASEPQRQALLAHMAAAGLEADGVFELHRFNPPFTIPIFRHNEVLIPIRKESLAKAGLAVVDY